MLSRNVVPNRSARWAGLIASATLAAACGTTAATGPLGGTQNSDELCAGVPAKEREMGILAYRDNFAGASILTEYGNVGKVKIGHERGATLGVRALPGLTAQWLERIAICHVASVRAGKVQGAENDPFVVAGAESRVEQSNMAFLVSIRGGSDDIGHEIIARTAAVIGAPTLAK